MSLLLSISNDLLNYTAQAEGMEILVEKLSFMTILCQLGCIIPNICVTLDHFPIILDISCHFGQCHKRPYFLLVKL